MLNKDEMLIEHIIVHRIGSKADEQDLALSESSFIPKDEDTIQLLMHFLLKPFKPGEFFHLSNTVPVSQNIVFSAVSDIFEDPACFDDRSRELAQYLYELSEDPNLRAGEFFMVYFSNCLIEGDFSDAIGLFKQENNENYLKVDSSQKVCNILQDEGLNINKLDRGCLIFNLEKEKGFLVSMIDNQSKSEGSRIWRETFLNVMVRKDEFQQTKGYLDLCKSFVLEQVPKEFEVSRADQADMLNKSANYFKKNEEFSFNEFTDTVIGDAAVIDSFKGYKKQFETSQQVNLDENFIISDPALKKQSKVFKSVIKLDKNFHVYVHGNKEYIVKGFDESTGMHYYQLFFSQEE